VSYRGGLLELTVEVVAGESDITRRDRKQQSWT
jgi:hypothetical protein